MSPTLVRPAWLSDQVIAYTSCLQLLCQRPRNVGMCDCRACQFTEAAHESAGAGPLAGQLR